MTDQPGKWTAAMVRRRIVQAIMAGKPTRQEAFNLGMAVLEQRDQALEELERTRDLAVRLEGELAKLRADT